MNKEELKRLTPTEGAAFALASTSGGVHREKRINLGEHGGGKEKGGNIYWKRRESTADLRGNSSGQYATQTKGPKYPHLKQGGTGRGGSGRETGGGTLESGGLSPPPRIINL